VFQQVLVSSNNLQQQQQQSSVWLLRIDFTGKGKITFFFPIPFLCLFLSQKIMEFFDGLKAAKSIHQIYLEISRLLFEDFNSFN
jgi:hypothetical protein